RQVWQYNRRSAVIWETIREFLALHYIFNTRLQTPFWRACVEDTDLCGAQEFVEFYRENGPSTLWRNQVIDARNPFGFEGYLSMMIGMNVPYPKRYTPPEHEKHLCHNIYGRVQSTASQAVTIPEALSCIRAPWWQWPTELYQDV